MTQHKPVTPDDLLAAARAAQKAGKLPPVEAWDPPFCGDLDMEIAADGTWFYQGTPIGRKPMVRLFSTILKREGERYFLVTPVEKVGLRVVDAPFVAVDMEAAGDGQSQVVTFETNVGDTVVCDAQHPLRVERAEDGEPRPYVTVRRGLEARIDRKSFYRLVDLGEVSGKAFGVWSSGAFFAVAPASDVEV